MRALRGRAGRGRGAKHDGGKKAYFTQLKSRIDAPAARLAARAVRTLSYCSSLR